jgi:hypothetical protein
VNQGVPFLISSDSRPISQAVTRLAEHVLEVWAVAEQVEAAAEPQADDPARRRLGRFFR